VRVPLPGVIRRFGQQRKARRHSIRLAAASGKQRQFGVAQPRRSFGQRVEHRLQIKGRAADDLQHFARRGLVFERFFEVARARVQFIEQPDILDRDDGLVGEGLQEIDLRLRKRRDVTALDVDCPDRDAVAQHWHC